jgi:hypothetical protein
VGQACTRPAMSSPRARTRSGCRRRGGWPGSGSRTTAPSLRGGGGGRVQLGKKERKKQEPPRRWEGTARHSSARRGPAPAVQPPVRPTAGQRDCYPWASASCLRVSAAVHPRRHSRLRRPAAATRVTPPTSPYAVLGCPVHRHILPGRVLACCLAPTASGQNCAVPHWAPAPPRPRTLWHVHAVGLGAVQVPQVLAAIAHQHVGLVGCGGPATRP